MCIFEISLDLFDWIDLEMEGVNSSKPSASVYRRKGA